MHTRVCDKLPPAVPLPPRASVPQVRRSRRSHPGEDTRAHTEASQVEADDNNADCGAEDAHQLRLPIGEERV